MGLGNHRFSVDYQPGLSSELIALSALFIEPFVDFLRKVFVWIHTARHLVNTAFVKGRITSELPRCPGVSIGSTWIVFRESACDLNAELILAYLEYEIRLRVTRISASEVQTRNT